LLPARNAISKSECVVKNMAKIFVDVFTPGNGKTYELQLNDSMAISAAKSRMAEEILHIEERSMSFHEQTQLCDLTTGAVLPDNAPLSAAGVKSGHRLLLV
jgi:uncharacterized ubiquitin-like protein YukD